MSALPTHTHTHTLPFTGTAESHHFNLLEDCKLTSNSDRNGCQIVKQEKDEKRSFVKCLAFPSFTVWAQFWCRLTSAGPVWRHRDSPCGERVGGGGFQSGSILTFCLLYLRLHTHTHTADHTAPTLVTFFTAMWRQQVSVPSALQRGWCWSGFLCSWHQMSTETSVFICTSNLLIGFVTFRPVKNWLSQTK